MSTKDIIKLDEEKVGMFETKALDMRTKSLAFKVVDEDTRVKAEKGIVVVKTLRKAIKELTGPNVSSLYSEWKKAKARENTVIQPLDEAEDYLKRQVKDFEMEKIRAQRRKEKEEEERREAELRKAEELAAQGKEEEADKVLRDVAEEEAAPIVPQVMEEKVKGTSKKTIEWKWRLKDLSAVPREFLMLDESKITRYVKAMREDAKISGIEIYEDIRFSTRI